MNITGRVKEWFRGIAERGKKNVVLSLLSPGADRNFSFFSNLFPTGVSDIELLRRITGWVYVCISINAQSIASIPLRLYSIAGRKATRGWEAADIHPIQRQHLADNADPRFQRAIVDGVEVQEITGRHPWNKIVASPNEVLEWCDVLELTVMWRQSTGDAFWYHVQDGLGIPREIWPLMPHRMKLVKKPKQPVAGWLYKQDALEKVFPEEAAAGIFAAESGKEAVFLPSSDVIHFRRVNPLDPYGRGLSPIRAGMLPIDTLVMMEEYTRRLIEGDGTPTFLLYSDEQRTEGFARRLLDSWMKMREDYGADAPGVLPGGWKAQVLGLSPKEMAYREGVENYLKEVAAIFGVPWAFLDTRNVNRANDLASDYRHKKGTIKPMCLRFASEINKSLVWPFYGDDLFVAFDECVPEDEKERTERCRVLVQGGVMTPNEARRTEKLPPISEKWADELWMQGATQPMSTLYKMGKSPQLGFPGNQPPMLPNKPKPKPQQPGQKSLCCHDEREFEPIENDPYAPTEAMLAALKTYFHKQRLVILSNLERSQRDKEPFGDDWDDDLTETMNSHIETAMKLGMIEAGRRIVKVTGFPIADFDIERPEAKALLEQIRYNLRYEVWHGVNETTRKQVTQTISHGMMAGETTEQLVSRINVIYDRAESWRAYMIARDRTAHAHNNGAELVYVASGIEYKEWLCAFGPCAECEPLNGDRARVGQPFPRSGLMGPPLHQNCRCVEVPVVLQPTLK